MEPRVIYIVFVSLRECSDSMQNTYSSALTGASPISRSLPLHSYIAWAYLNSGWPPVVFFPSLGQL